jgi:hypothetical protein
VEAGKGVSTYSINTVLYCKTRHNYIIVIIGTYRMVPYYDIHTSRRDSRGNRGSRRI